MPDNDSKIGYSQKLRERLTRAENLTRAEKKGATRIGCCLYCLLLCILGMVFPISDTLTNVEMENGYYTESYQFALCLGAIGIMVYVLLVLVRDIQPLTADEPSNNKHQRNNGDIAVIDVGKTDERGDPPMDPEIHIGGAGTNLYFRIGGFVFSLGAAAYCALRFVAAYEGVIPPSCHGPFKQAVDIVMIIFTLMQSFLYVKYHTLVINRHKAVMRMCMMHLVATNLALWLSATTHETANDIGHKLYNLSVSENSSEHGRSCHDSHTVYDYVSRFVYPTVIEYGLFGAGAAYALYLNIGKQANRSRVATMVASPKICSKAWCHNNFHRSYPGMILGLVVVVSTAAGIGLFYSTEDKEASNPADRAFSEYIFLLMELMLMIAALVSATFMYLFLRNLKYVGIEEDNFDTKLLIVTQSGVYALAAFMLLGAIHALNVGVDVQYGLFFLAHALISVVQSSFQTSIIIDGFSRTAHRDEHCRKKPGQSVITLLVLVNLSMWMSATFIFAEVGQVEFFDEFFGIIPWSMITRLFTPLVIFYRFQSSTSLADIWQKAYKTRQID
ncbi:proton channel OtopLc-like [Tubulanus polymorphus]|uniref:proton channel OtopLc-like n=1 Tax=Tubulanus polymorphus TaxID=672921 RepID=UPI003DA251FD